MKRVSIIVIALASAASPMAFAEEAKPLQLKVPKAALTTGLVTHSNAPFNTPLGEPDLGLIAKHDTRHEQSRSACSNTSTLCYDASENRIVYKPARNFMPDLPGMTRENISLKRDRVVFRYSF
jgi:hypothetical protein